MVSENFKNQICKHFEHFDERNARLSERAVKSEAKAATYQENFERAKNEVIEPCFAVVRNMLLSRKCPAVITSTPPDSEIAMSGGGSGYVGLHCSNDPQKQSTVEKMPMFRIAFSLDRGVVQYYAKNSFQRGVPEKISGVLTIDNITQQNIEAMGLGQGKRIKIV